MRRELNQKYKGIQITKGPMKNFQLSERQASHGFTLTSHLLVPLLRRRRECGLGCSTHLAGRGFASRAQALGLTPRAAEAGHSIVPW